MGEKEGLARFTTMDGVMFSFDEADVREFYIGQPKFFDIGII
jgi:hypothetical protein